MHLVGSRRATLPSHYSQLISFRMQMTLKSWNLISHFRGQKKSFVWIAILLRRFSPTRKIMRCNETATRGESCVGGDVRSKDSVLLSTTQICSFRRLDTRRNFRQVDFLIGKNNSVVRSRLIKEMHSWNASLLHGSHFSFLVSAHSFL